MYILFKYSASIFKKNRYQAIDGEKMIFLNLMHYFDHKY
jgi:hypothetical protein